MEPSAQSIRDRAAAALQKLRTAHAPAEPEAAAPEAPPAEEPAKVIQVQAADVLEPESAYDSLSDRQRIFVDELVSGKTQAEAAKIAGYGPERPDISGSKLMTRADVRKAVQERRELAAEAAGINQQQLLKEMADIAYGRIDAMNEPIVRMRALENLLKYTSSGKAGDNSNSNVAREIAQRFQKARLVNGGQAKRPLLRAVP